MRRIRSKAGEVVAEAYAAKLLTVTVAGEKFGLSRTTFCRLRRRHKIPLLPGLKVHVDDVIAALEKEREHR